MEAQATPVTSQRIPMQRCLNCRMFIQKPWRYCDWACKLDRRDSMRPKGKQKRRLLNGANVRRRRVQCAEESLGLIVV
jgi:hypothetical protein